MKNVHKALSLLLAAMLTCGMAACGKGTTDAPQQPQPLVLETEPAVTETEPPQTEPAQTQPREERFLLTFVGDCTLGSNPHNQYAIYGFPNTVQENWDYPFANVITYFEGDDFTMVNLEGALCDSGVPVPKAHNFRGPCEYVNILTESSVEAVTIANNHSRDYGEKGYESTAATLDQAGIPYAEENTGKIFTLDSGLTIGVYGAVYYSLDVEDMVSEITAMKEAGADLIIFAPHWGAEGYYTPNNVQEEAGRAAIDAGAHIVYGSHPHVLQPIEEYNGGIIYYSLGNFCFGGNLYPDDYDTVLLQQEVIRDPEGNVRLGELTVVPCCLSSVADHNNFQPTPYAEDSEGYARVLKKLGLSE